MQSAMTEYDHDAIDYADHVGVALDDGGNPDAFGDFLIALVIESEEGDDARPGDALAAGQVIEVAELE